MRIEPKFYKTRVAVAEGNAYVICVTYNLDVAKSFVGIEYFELVWALPDPKLTIPSSRQASFQEELRVLHQAASTFQGQRGSEQEHILGKLKEAYGTDATVYIQVIDPKTDSSAL